MNWCVKWVMSFMTHLKVSWNTQDAFIFTCASLNIMLETAFSVLPAHKAFSLHLLLWQLTITVPLVCFHTASPTLSILCYVCASTMTCRVSVGLSSQVLHTQSAEQMCRDIHQGKTNPSADTDDSQTKVYLWNAGFHLVHLYEYSMEGWCPSNTSFLKGQQVTDKRKNLCTLSDSAYWKVEENSKVN